MVTATKTAVTRTATGSNGNGSNGHASHGQGAAVAVEAPPVDNYGKPIPARIGRVFAPPMDAMHAVHMHLPEEMATADIIHKLWNICREHHGNCEVWLHIDNGIELLQLRVSEGFFVDPCQEFVDQILDVLGDGHLLVPRPL